MDSLFFELVSVEVFVRDKERRLAPKCILGPDTSFITNYATILFLKSWWNFTAYKPKEQILFKIYDFCDFFVTKKCQAIFVPVQIERYSRHRVVKIARAHFTLNDKRQIPLLSWKLLYLSKECTFEVGGHLPLLLSSAPQCNRWERSFSLVGSTNNKNRSCSQHSWHTCQSKQIKTISIYGNLDPFYQNVLQELSCICKSEERDKMWKLNKMSLCGSIDTLKESF